MRLDSELVNRGLYTTRARAVAAIDAGLVSVNGVVVTKASKNVTAADKIDAGDLPFISGRGSLKLEHALKEFKVNPTGYIALDIGSSTGGFTEVLLNHGASHVIAVEVGTDQMIPALRNDPRVLLMEETDIRDVVPNTRPDLIVIDVSFIPLSGIVDAVAKWDAPVVIALIKPQFEVPVNIAKKNKGIIKSAEDHQFAIDNATVAFEKHGYERRGLTPSPVRGGSGNVEYLGLFVKNA